MRKLIVVYGNKIDQIPNDQSIDWRWAMQDYTEQRGSSLLWMTINTAKETMAGCRCASTPMLKRSTGKRELKAILEQAVQKRGMAYLLWKTSNDPELSVEYQGGKDLVEAPERALSGTCT